MLLGRWQERELRVAHAFAECRDLSREQLEDLYQESVIALLDRGFESEEHLRNALRSAIKRRALNLHRDVRSRREILERVSERQREPEDVSVQEAPERAALSHEDRLVVREFLAQLSRLEQRVFWLGAEGMRYRAIATALSIPETEARNAARACERKREQFQLLYETGRLCGYRAMTIRALKDGQKTSDELADQAFAHLERCAHCRMEHQLSAGRLRERFQGQTAVVLPFSVGLGRLAGLAFRARLIAGRMSGSRLLAQGLRERAAAVIAGSGVAGKLAVGAAGVAVIAGGAIGAGQALQASHLRSRHRPGVATPAAITPILTPTMPSLSSAAATVSLARQARARSQPGRPVPLPSRAKRAPGRPVSRPQPQAESPSQPRPQPAGSEEPGGFAYLGVPAHGEPQAASQSEGTTEGGPFSP